MKSYNALALVSKDERFNEFPINLRIDTPVHKNTKISWIEELDENYTDEEWLWYQNIIENNLVKDEIDG